MNLCLGQFKVPPVTKYPTCDDLFIDLRPTVGNWANPYYGNGSEQRD